jgi:hypothetical protein
MTTLEGWVWFGPGKTALHISLVKLLSLQRAQEQPQQSVGGLVKKTKIIKDGRKCTLSRII